ncbi:hypothetical protein QYS48_29215 [Marivirga arenosa]|uniref:Uncharacterized protein n=1 Tax=Marivirga arenosa TaxID=3059076 RepID=A0AA51R7F4_9BACT|nr:hypothetical protein [Marivirga sp. ABR2-2]WMN07582.1 hypothetical protein QYS48_29215 [Marivirga sp. ABR2-2]
MKRITIILIAIISIVSIDANAQKSFEKGTNLLNAGFGFGYYGYGFGVGTRSFSVPAITANYEVGVGDFIGVGPYVGFASWNYRSAGFEGGYSIFAFGGRASFHLTDVLLNDALDLGVDPNLDFYGSIIFGFNVDGYTGDFTNNYNNGLSVSFGPILGFRYYFNDSFGAYIEGGRGTFSYGTIGITVKM